MFDLICLDLIHAQTEHSVQTGEEEKDHKSQSPWVHPCVWILGYLVVECLVLCSG